MPPGVPCRLGELPDALAVRDDVDQLLALDAVDGAVGRRAGAFGVLLVLLLVGRSRQRVGRLGRFGLGGPVPRGVRRRFLAVHRPRRRQRNGRERPAGNAAAAGHGVGGPVGLALGRVAAP